MPEGGDLRPHATGLDLFAETEPDDLKNGIPLPQHLRHGAPGDEIARETQLENAALIFFKPTWLKKGLRIRMSGNWTVRSIARVEPQGMVLDRSFVQDEFSEG